MAAQGHMQLELEREILLMTNFHHPNVVSFLGAFSALASMEVRTDSIISPHLEKRCPVRPSISTTRMWFRFWALSRRSPRWRWGVGLYNRWILFLGLCARISTIMCAPTLCFGTSPSVSAHTIAQYNASPRPPRYCNIYHTILVMAISCKGQVRTHSIISPLLKGCPVRLSRTKQLFHHQTVLMTLVLLIMNDGFSFYLPISCSEFFRGSWVNRWWSPSEVH